VSSYRNAVTYTADSHHIAADDISPNAIEVLEDLQAAGFDAYLVGGCLRDLLCQRQPKDFDVVTNATPEEIKNVFRRCRLIGRRFRLAHVPFNKEIIEVATFRADEKGETNAAGQVIDHNAFGTIETDAMRRDFTINALYYDLSNEMLIDYTGAFEDIQEGIIRIIGSPVERYAEDPVRMLRAVRFAAKLGMRMSQETEQAIAVQKHLLKNIAPTRLFDETIKLFMSGHALASYEALRIYDLFSELLPMTDGFLKQFEHHDYAQNNLLIRQALKNTDKRLANDETVTIAFLYAVILWPLYQQQLSKRLEDGMHWHSAIHDAIDQVFYQSKGLPMRHKGMVRDIWLMQSRLATKKLNKRRMQAILMHKRFRAGYDFLALRLTSGEKDLAPLYERWTKAQIEMPEAMAVHQRTYRKKRRVHR